MRPLLRRVLSAFLVLAFSHATPAMAQDLDADALNLEAAPEDAPAAPSGTTLFIEAAAGRASQRYQPGSRDLGRISLDFSHSARLAPGLRAVISDRLDYLHPAQAGTDAGVNSLREAYLSWQPEAGNTVMEVGRINLRYGPGYGYNPTDFFRDGTLRTLTTANPFAMRENRLGSFMLRAQRLWAAGSVSLAYSPKLEDAPDADGMSLDWGATNNRDRAVLALSLPMSPAISSQFLLYKEQGNSATVGANFTALLSDAAVAHLEWSRGREPDLLSRALGLPTDKATRNRFSSGVTYTTLGKLSLTAEYQYNGFALNENQWSGLGAASPAAQVAYLLEAQRRQDLAPQNAYLIYLTQKALFHRDVDLTAFLRINADDHSRLAWLELRRHWPSLDLALQLQHHSGGLTTEYGILPDRRVVQVLGSYFF